jgi:hypothetical protein
MKQITTLLLCFIGITTYAEIEQPDYWQVKSIEKDSTLQPNQTRLTLLVFNKDNGKPLSDATVHLNIDTYLGLTDSNGTINLSSS